MATNESVPGTGLCPFDVEGMADTQVERASAHKGGNQSARKFPLVGRRLSMWSRGVEAATPCPQGQLIDGAPKC